MLREIFKLKQRFLHAIHDPRDTKLIAKLRLRISPSRGYEFRDGSQTENNFDDRIIKKTSRKSVLLLSLIINLGGGT